MKKLAMLETIQFTSILTRVLKSSYFCKYFLSFESFNYVTIASLEDMFYDAPNALKVEAKEVDETEPEISIIKFTADDLMNYIDKVKNFRLR